MKRIIPITLLLFLSLTAAGQDPELFDKIWYLYEVNDTEGDNFYVEGYQPYGGNPMIPQITPYVIIDEDFSFNGLGICNTFEGTLEYDVIDNNFRPITSETTNMSCGALEDLDEPTVIGPFGRVDPDPTFYTILNPTITNDADGFQTMIYGTQPFVGYLYRTKPILSLEDRRVTSFVLAPNPVQNELFFSEVNSTSEINSIRIYSVHGTVVMSISKPKGPSISVETLENGLYLLEIVTTIGKETHKILKQ